jgi:hypothetical protein
MFVGSAFSDGTLLDLGSEELVRAGAGEIKVPGYSVPSFVDWDNDGLRDLVIGEGSGSYTAKVRVYLNMGTSEAPQFSNYFYAQSNGADLVCSGSGCMGCFPRVVYWDTDNRKDLLVGQSTGTIKLFLNVGTDDAPTFDAGTLLQAGSAGAKVNINVGSRPTPTIVDWNSDGRGDLVAGAIDGLIHIYIDEGTGPEPDFVSKTLARTSSGNLDIGSRSSPEILDLDCDGKKDIVAGETYGRLLFYRNLGTDQDPVFGTYEAVESDGAAIDLTATRSRPSVCYWTDDAYPDVLIGASDGRIHLYQGTPIGGDLNGDGMVNFLDLAEFAAMWHQVDCGACGGADLLDDEIVDLQDLAVLAGNWLATPCP